MRDRLVVGARDRAGQDARALADADRADERRFGGDVRRGRDLRRLVVDAVEGHSFFR